MIADSQRALLKQLFETGKAPEGLSQKTLQLYKTLAQRATSMGKDQLGVQAQRLQMISKLTTLVRGINLMEFPFNLSDENLRRSLAETVSWCENQQFTSSTEEPDEVKHRRLLGEQGAELIRRAYTNRDRFWNKLLCRNYTDTHLWRRGAELQRKANLGAIAPLKEQLRTPALSPSTSLSEAREEQLRQEIVRAVIVKRSELIHSARPVPEPSVNVGRLLLYIPAENLADGAARYASKGFFDVDNTPPWDTWVAFSSGTLLSWVPQQLEGLAQSGIDANPECCIRWLNSQPSPVG